MQRHSKMPHFPAFSTSKMDKPAQVNIIGKDAIDVPFAAVIEKGAGGKRRFVAGAVLH